jgi:hypothetical protein
MYDRFDKSIYYEPGGKRKDGRLWMWDYYPEDQGSYIDLFPIKDEYAEEILKAFKQGREYFVEDFKELTPDEFIKDLPGGVLK